ncbi:MAG: hypothetical protein M3253_06930 [Chloroflexota bacterium]|nr:hypothetical protein [Chloroflexota bacterium]
MIDTATYRLTIDALHPIGHLSDRRGGPPTQLMLVASFDSDRGLDGTLATGPPHVEETDGNVEITVEAQSTTWAEKRIRLRCTDEGVAFEATVAGSARLGDVRLLGGWYTANPRWGGGLFHSRWPVRTLFVPSPDDPRRVLQPAAEPAAIGVIGGDMPGRGHWFFTPAPFLLAGSRAEVSDPDDPSAAPWQTLELHTDVTSATFSELRYAPFLGGFSMVLAYDELTAVEGAFTSPPLFIRLDVPDPYDALQEHAALLRGSGAAPRATRRPSAWWSRPIFCGWGEQFRQSRLYGGHPQSHCRQENYDRWLKHLAEREIVPGTIVVDDKWQTTYGRNEVDAERWPDLRGWINERHAAGQHVLLWLKAWDAEGLPSDACITDRLGNRVVADPNNSAYRAMLRNTLQGLLGPTGLDADGLKIDFTGQTPSGPGLHGAGSRWGVALLHRLLALIHDLAKEAKEDALVVTHTPNPLFADVTDMIRLNDLLRLGDQDPWAAAVPQMRHRARIAAAVDPGLLIDTDDWCMPSKSEWRAYLEAKSELGVPALYYVTGIDHSGEAFDDDDYAAIRAAWARWQARLTVGSRR